MTKVTNLLQLADDASQEAIVSAINSLTEAKAQAEAQLAEAQTQLKQATKAHEEATAKVAELEGQVAEATTETAEMKAENLINQYATRIGDAKDSFKAMAVKNYAETEAILKQLPLNVVANPIPDQAPAPARKTAASVMLEIQHRLKNI